MLNRNKLRAEIVKNGYTQADVAKKLDISEKTFISRMKNGVFKNLSVISSQYPGTASSTQVPLVQGFSVPV